VYFGSLGVRGPIYGQVGQGLSDREIAKKLHLTEVMVENCISWMLHSFKITDRVELVSDAFSAAQPSSPVASLRVA
jgi:DNA-binding NarL/FixJ family response regulator